VYRGARLTVRNTIRHTEIKYRIN